MAQYTCQECGATFNTQAEREQHNRMVHSQYRCDTCGEVFESEDELESHCPYGTPRTAGNAKAIV